MGMIEVQNLSKEYGKDKNIIKAVDNISFSVDEGEFVSIIGPSGSGKSTLLHMLGGVDNPSEGKVLIDGIDLYSLNDKEISKLRRTSIGLIYQFYNLVPYLNVYENICLPTRLDNQKVNEKRVDEIIHFLKLEDRLNHYPNELSGGEQQRVAIGRVLLNNPRVILADEPTGNLDSKNSKEIIDLLRKANKQFKQTIILVTHDLNIAKKASRLIVLKDGQIKSDEWVKS